MSFCGCRVESEKTESTAMNPLNTIITILAVLSASLALAEDFKTVSGKEYKQATVSRVEPDGVVLKSKSGISKVYFVELPKEIQQRFGYEPQKAVTYQAQQNAAVTQAQRGQENVDAAQRQTDASGVVTGSGHRSEHDHSGGGSVHVHGYTRKDGTYVQPHTRAVPGTASHSISGKR
jgi:hypothetical protein